MNWFSKREPKTINIGIDGFNGGHATIEHIVKHEWSQRPLPMAAEMMWLASDGRPIYHDYKPVVGGDLEIFIPPVVFAYEDNPNAQVRLRVTFKYPPRA